MWSIGTLSSILLIFIILMSEIGETRISSKEKLTKTQDVKLYTMRQFEGKMLRLRIEDNACENLPSTWENKVESVDPSGCVILYADPDCRGFRKRLDKWSFGSTNLKDIAFDSKLSSVSTCPIVKKPVIPDEL